MALAAASLAPNPLIANHMEPRDRNCIYPTGSRDGETQDPVGQCARRIRDFMLIEAGRGANGE